MTKTRILIRRDIEANWIAKNPVLSSGEQGYSTDRKYLKIGDGTSPWNELSTIKLPKAAIDGLEDVNTNTIYSLSNVTETSFSLMSADGTVDSPVWSQVTSYTAKSWQGEIDTALNTAKTLIGSLSSYVGTFEPVSEREEVSSVVKYVDYKVEGLVGALHYIGSTAKQEGETVDEAIARLLAEKHHEAKSGDIVIVDTAEYIYDGETWKLIGDEGVYETKAGSEAKLTEAKEYADDQLAAHVKKMHVHDDIEIIEGTASEGKYCNIVANGIPVVVREGETADIVDVWYDNGQKKVSVDRTQYPGGVSLFGGCGNADDDPTYLPATSVKIESGKLTSVFAGSMNAGNVGVANVTLNGGEITSGVIGGRSDGSSSIPATKKHHNNIGLLNITVNGGKAAMVYGGSNGFSTVNKSCIIVNAGEIGYLTAGGANGDVLDAHVEVNGGNIGLYQSVNRGTVCSAELTLNGGTIATCYAGGESTDSTVNGRYLKSSLILLGGQVNRLWTGTNGGTVDASCVSGKYAESITFSETDSVIDKLEKIRTFGEMAYKDVVTEVDLSGEFTFDCGDATTNS